jgi:SRSO17 transposase
MRLARGNCKEVWLLIEWPESEKEPTKYFLGDLPASYKLRRLVRLAKCRWKIEQDYQQLKEEMGLDHYEGRSWTGWHHHTTLVMLAHAFLTLEMLRSKKTSGWTLPQTRREIQLALHLHWLLRLLWSERQPFARSITHDVVILGH